MAINNAANVADPLVIYALKFLVGQAAKNATDPREANIVRELKDSLKALQSDPTNGGTEPTLPGESV